MRHDDERRPRGSNQLVVTLAIIGAMFMVCLVGAGVLIAVANKQGAQRMKKLADAKASERSGSDLSEAEIRAMADRLVETLQAGDPTFFDERCDLDALADRAFQGLGLKPAFLRGVKDGMKKQGLGRKVVSGLANHEHTLKVLRIDTGEKPRVLVRILLADSGVNYQEYYICKGPNRKVMFEDIYVFMLGATMSETIRRMNARALPSLKKGDVPQYLEDTFKMAKHVQNGEYAKALEAYHDLPEKQQRQKEVLIVRLSAAQFVNEEAYNRALEDIAKFGLAGNPGLAIVVFDYYIQKERYADAHRALDRLMKAVKDSDPYLYAMRANLYVLEGGKLDEAMSQAQVCIEREPDQIEGYYAMLGVAIEQKDHHLTAEQLTLIESKFELSYGDIREVPEFAEFVKSAAYEKWEQQRPALEETAEGE